MRCRTCGYTYHTWIGSGYEGQCPRCKREDLFKRFLDPTTEVFRPYFPVVVTGPVHDCGVEEWRGQS